MLGIDERLVHVEVDDVGGSFGIKANLYPEYLLAVWAARRLGRAVAWMSERSEGFLSDYHARDNVTEAALALDAEGRFLALQVRTIVNIGAYLSPLGAGPAVNNLGGLAGVYRTPVAHVEVRGALTNTQPTAPYRGAGRPEAAFVIERIIDAAAAELGIDRVELRRRNIIGTDELPFRTPLGFIYDSGDFAANMDRALALADADGLAARRKAAAQRGRLVGLGIANAIERAAPPGLEYAEIRFDPSGGATVLCGATAQGQGHMTTFAQVLNDQLGLAPDRVRFVQGDTERLAYGFGAGGSRISALGTAAILAAGERIIAKARTIAAHVLEAPEDDLEFADGAFTIAGTDRSISLEDVARRAFQPAALPPGVEPGLYETATFKATVASYPNGCHVCEVEIDPETGRVAITGYVVVDDFGTLINPLLVKGQVHGGVAQGAGQVLMETMVLRARQRPDAGRVVHGLCHAAWRRPADDRGGKQPGADQDQSARRQGRGRGRQCRRAARRHERHRRCPDAAGRHRPRDARNSRTRLARDPRGEAVKAGDYRVDGAGAAGLAGCVHCADALGHQLAGKAVALVVPMPGAASVEAVQELVGGDRVFAERIDQDQGLDAAVPGEGGDAAVGIVEPLDQQHAFHRLCARDASGWT